MSYLPQVETPLEAGNVGQAPVMAAATATALAKLHSERVRSGMQVLAESQDLVLTNVLSHGGELIASGSVHVYGKAQGRILAGVDGNTEARIFCLQFYPQLVSIAGRYHVFETISEDLAGKPVLIWLENESLRFQVMG